MKDKRLAVKTAAINGYKIYWLCITKVCNNNCLFCLDHDNRADYFINLKEAERIINKAYKNRYNKIVISGGEPTLHPQLTEIAGLARQNNFKKIQIISNGRRFSDPKFALKCITAGINEFTLSLHSHDPDIQDKLYGGKGFGQQAQNGLANLVKLSKLIKIPIIINIDIVLNRLNIKDLLKTIKYYSKKFNVFEFDLLFPIPFGNAIQNRTEIFFDLEKTQKYLKPVFNFYRKHKEYFIWLNRFPSEFLDGYEDLIQDPRKILSEIEGNKQNIENLIKHQKNFPCQDFNRCSLCHLRIFCQILHQYYLKNFLLENGKLLERSINLSDYLEHRLKHRKQTEIVIKLDDLGSIKNNAKILDIYKKYWKNIKLIDGKNIIIYDLPRCLFKNNPVIKNTVLANLGVNKDFNDFLVFYLNRLNKIKSVKCKKCKYFKACNGIHLEMIRKLGFQILKPQS